ncbi:unnamed protein product [Didymodactylos carnosus]|uniref:Uncharacterized protein n=1 Tax=Didymodactylos carnosus TaxID=1234261 RepID=A0A8S2DN80_9BILA|nr:unnamed protein product [Didymodactylos carnosus]CAF3735238.1 unnamed protein product [Didymodactylos carnosus]
MDRSTRYRHRERIKQGLLTDRRLRLSIPYIRKSRRKQYKRNDETNSTLATVDQTKNILTEENDWINNDVMNDAQADVCDTGPSIEMNDIISEFVPNIDELVVNSLHQNRCLTESELATVLIMFKIKFNVSRECVVFILWLLRRCSVPNVPRSYHTLVNILRRTSNVPMRTTSCTFCEECQNISRSTDHCENNTCSQFTAYSVPQKLGFLEFEIERQIRYILERESNIQLKTKQNTNSLHVQDICDGKYYQRILNIEKDYPFITLSINVDGIAIDNSREVSIWVFTFVINEIERRHRFRLNNAIIGGVYPGDKKPNRLKMAGMIKCLSYQLKHLEKPSPYVLKCEQGEIRNISVFLILASCDKPAVSLVQNRPEPHAAFGCIHCEEEGITIRSNDKTNHCKRVFPPVSPFYPQPHLRSNEAYDKAIHSIENKAPNDLKTNKQIAVFARKLRGYLGYVHFRELKYFRIGVSFIFDSLHTLYQGCFNEKFSCVKHLRTLTNRLNSFTYPSTTYRYPRPLYKWPKYKANELRSLLLVGFVIFDGILDHTYYTHLLTLVIASHLCESRSTEEHYVGDITLLMNHFVYLFPKLYGTKYHVQNVHSTGHMDGTVDQFGPFQNCSTFGFESLLGIITATVMGTKNFGQELMNTITNIQLAERQLYETSFDSRTRNILSSLFSKYRMTFTQQIDSDSYRMIKKIINVYQARRVIAMTKTNDGIVLLKLPQQFSSCAQVALIEEIIKVKNEIFLAVQLVETPGKLTLTLDSHEVLCPFVYVGSINSLQDLLFLPASCIIEKMSSYYDKANEYYYYLQYPSLTEST